MYLILKYTLRYTLIHVLSIHVITSEQKKRKWKRGEKERRARVKESGGG